MMKEANIFLQGHQKGGELWVTSDTLAALFTLQYCQNPAVSVILVEPRELKQNSNQEQRDFEYSTILGEHGHINGLGELSNSSGEHEHCSDLEVHEQINRCEGHEHSNSHREFKQSNSGHPSDAGALRDYCIFPVDPSVFTFKYSVLEEEDCPFVLSNCALPAALLNSEPVWCVAGLCSTLRFMLHHTVDSHPEHHAAHLLGFRRSCLQACAEVSVWTKFCEVEALRALREVAVYGCVKFKGQGDSENAGKRVDEARENGELEKTGSMVEEGGGDIEVNIKINGKLNEQGGSERTGRVIKETEEDVKLSSQVDDCVQREAKSRVLIVAELVRYERHLQRPPLLHNALKIKHQYIRDTVQDEAERDRLLQLPLAQLPDIEHKYAEGLNLTLADVLLFVSFHIMITKLQSLVTLDTAIPLVLKWHKVILENEYVKGAVPVLSSSLAHLCSSVCPDFPLEAVIPNAPDESIYKSDPERYKPRWRSFTHQQDIDVVLGMLDDKDVELEYNDHPADNVSLPWSSLPPSVSPKEGQLPPSRLERKCQQLENVVTAVESVAQDGNIIVDFCAGGGHVGIILAYRLPSCKIVLVENKQASLLRAKERVDALDLKNVVCVQCNLDYFKGSFDIGVCLHACGVATDLVLLKCMEQRAAFVCSPCCYGGVQANHILTYPRSQTFRDLPLTLDQYLTLGHTADQTHGQNNPKTSQGQRCMRLVDSDRLKAAQEMGYSITLTLMHPPHCSPKNHLLIGAIGS